MGLSIGGWIARASQGMGGIVGSKLAPAYAMGKAAAPALGGAIQGVGIGVGVEAGRAVTAPAKSILGWFADLKPENLYSGMVVFAVLLYFLDWVTGFDITKTATLRAFGFGIGGFAVLMLTERSYIKFWRVVIAVVFFYSVYGLLNVLTGTFNLGFEFGVITSLLTNQWTLIAFVLGSGALYVNLPIPGPIKFLPVFMLLETYGLPVFRERILDSVANISYAAFFVAFLANRILFPLPLAYTVFAFYKESRTARKILGLLVIVYLIASLPQIKAAYAQYAGLEGAEIEQAKGVLARLQANIRSIVSGEIFRAPTESLYEKAQIAFGFGTPKEEPKMGLQLRDDPNMPKVFNLEFYDAAAPSVIMEVPNPLPLTDPRKRVMSVVHIECNDKTTGGSGVGKVVEPLPEPKPNESATYALVYYKGPKQVTCRFEKMKEGSNTAEIKVKYGFVADAEFSTPFMRRDRLEDKIFKGEDPVVKDNVPSSTAEYDNGPIAVTWGSVELVSPPVDIKASSPLGFLLFVSKTGSWEGEIAGINSLTLTIPSEFELVEKNDKTCAFQKVKEKSNADVNVYKVKDDLIKNKGIPRFIGDGVRLMCGMIATGSLINELAGPDDEDRRRPWKAGTFKASVDYIFSTEKTVSFEIKGCRSGDTKDCTVKDTNCPGKQTCNADGWGKVCNDIPDDGCPKGGGGA